MRNIDFAEYLEIGVETVFAYLFIIPVIIITAPLWVPFYCIGRLRVKWFGPPPETRY